ncbi:MAG: metalloregulator ArsR/SmtB family transcription factor [Deltaproteobacteria bacterium]|jgi:ArsR family transcriptional regulator|nr:metalloregulator ArsR/SmtB family transcription factor [Deltaproteobacteria bacterium]
MFDFLNITKALTDENRVRILMALRRRELCVCQTTAFLDLAPSTTSKHLSVLRQARLIEGKKRGKWVYYRLPGEGCFAPARDALAFLERHLACHPLILRDEERLLKLMEREDLFCAGMGEDGLHSIGVHLLEESDEDK